MTSGTGKSQVDIALVYPGLLGTYGDRGNATVLAKRLQWRGIPAEVHTVEFTDEIPTSADVYVLGGAEDSAQILAMDRLRASDAWRTVANRDVPVLAVCAGLQVLGGAFHSSDGKTYQGAGMLDVDTGPGRTRAVGELVTSARDLAGVEMLTGFENHLGRSTIGDAADPLGTVVDGIGNDESAAGTRVEGVRQGKVIGTYLHGPALARNPALADLLLRWAVGEELAPLELDAVTALRRKYLGRHGQAA